MPPWSEPSAGETFSRCSLPECSHRHRPSSRKRRLVPPRLASSFRPPNRACGKSRRFPPKLLDLGYVEGKTFVLEVRYGDANLERLPELARDLVNLNVKVIVASTDQVIAAVRRQTSTIPIVMTGASDPVGTGFVSNLAHPGGNVTASA